MFQGCFKSVSRKYYFSMVVSAVKSSQLPKYKKGLFLKEILESNFFAKHILSGFGK